MGVPPLLIEQGRSARVQCSCTCTLKGISVDKRLRATRGVRRQPSRNLLKINLNSLLCITHRCETAMACAASRSGVEVTCVKRLFLLRIAHKLPPSIHRMMPSSPFGLVPALSYKSEHVCRLRDENKVPYGLGFHDQGT